MMFSGSKAAFTCFQLLLGVSLCWCIYRDIQIEKQYPGDLRNRIVGSRMEMDGLSPYFTHWKATNGLRYYDWDNSGTTLKISNVTATPFFHQLLYPIANLPQRTISRIWLALEYFAWLGITVLALQYAQERKQKWTVIFVSLLFLYTYAWLTHIGMGQMYIFIPLMAMLFYFFITRNATLLNAVLAGACAASLVLIRPNALLFLLPFLLLVNRYAFKYKMTLISAAVVVLLFAFGTGRSRFYWSEYLEAVNEHTRLHQDMGPSLQHSSPMPPLSRYEGWEMRQIENDQHFAFYKPMEEHGNVFVLLNTALHVKTPVWVLTVMSLGFMFLICIVFLKKYWKTPQLNACTVALLGFYLYMASDIFSPVHRFSYNTIQWLFPLLLTAGTCSSSFKRIYIAGILIGLVLNSLPVYLFPMRHTVGEYMIYASLLGLLFTLKPEPQV